MDKLYEAMYTHLMEECPPGPDPLAARREQQETAFEHTLTAEQSAAYRRFMETDAQYDAREELFAFRTGFSCAVALLLDAHRL